MNEKIRVGVADDHHLFRAGLIELLQTFGDIVVVGEASTAAGAIELSARESPDVMLLDLDMPDRVRVGSGGEAAARAILAAVRAHGSWCSRCMMIRDWSAN